MPKIVDADSQRDDIREAARRVFAERGVRGTGLTHVADAVGMGRSSLYHYYPDKDSLLADLVREMLEQERALFRTCLRGGTPLSRLEKLARACGALFPEWAAFGRLILELRLEDAKPLKRYFRGLRRDLGAVITEGQQDGSFSNALGADVYASMVLAVIDGLLLQYFVDPAAFPKPEALAGALCTTTRRIVAR